MTRRLLLLALAAGCAPPAPPAPPAPMPPPSASSQAPAPESPATPVITLDGAAGLTAGRMPDRREAALAAFRAGLMPLHATKVDAFAQLYPSHDGRGVLIAILDSGIDPLTDGLGTTSDSVPKLLDLRDFSGEGRIALAPVRVANDTIWLDGHHLAGAGRVLAMAGGMVWGGLVPEVRFGNGPAADLDANGHVADTLMVVVARGQASWLLFADTHRDGSLADDKPIRDYAIAREAFGWSASGTPTIGIAANLSDSAGTPRLDLVFDNMGHGTHVAGIAAGHDLFGVAGFDGVAPGARLLGLKIADDADGGVTTTGSMRDALAWAITYAAERQMPLVVNLSFGVGNQREGTARIDRVVDSILAAHPDVVMTVSASNDGPGLSTLGFPASATQVLSVGGTQPLVFSGLPPDAPTPDPVAIFSSRGGERAGPDLLAPGTAWSVVPRFDAGNEEKSGTSMASPHMAGVVARLLSIPRAGGPPRRDLVIQALRVTAHQLADASILDQGSGVPDIFAAANWLATHDRLPHLAVTIDGELGHDAIWLPVGMPPATVKANIRRTDSDAPLNLRIRSTVPWLTLEGPPFRRLAPEGIALFFRVDRAAFRGPAVRIGTVLVEDADDEGLGVLARVPVTVRVPLPDGDDPSGVVQLHAGDVGRFYFHSDSGRGFQAEVSTLTADGLALMALHEPGGQPFRDIPLAPAGHGDGAGLLQVDGHDAQEGWYELDVVAPPTSPVAARATIRHAPVRMTARLDSTSLIVDAHSLSAEAIDLRLRAAFTGAEWRRHVTGDRAIPAREPLVVPAWAGSMVVDVTMPEGDWSKFTDFGVSLRRSDGRLLAESPLNYAFGRMRIDLPSDVRGDSLTLVLSPAAASDAPPTPWTVVATVRFYLEQPMAIDRGGTPGSRVESGTIQRARFPIAAPPVQLPVGWAPLFTLIALEGDAAVWTRELAPTSNWKDMP